MKGKPGRKIVEHFPSRENALCKSTLAQGAQHVSLTQMYHIYLYSASILRKCLQKNSTAL